MGEGRERRVQLKKANTGILLGMELLCISVVVDIQTYTLKLHRTKHLCHTHTHTCEYK